MSPAKSAIGTLTEIPNSDMKQSSSNRRRRPLKSRTVDTLLRILSICYTDESSQTVRNSDKGGTNIGSLTNNHVSLECTDSIPNDSLFQEQTPMDETKVVLDAQEGGLYNRGAESAEFGYNMSGERNDLYNKAETDPLMSFGIESQDNDNYDMMISSPHLPTDKDVEEGEMRVDETRVLLDSQEGDFYDKHVESAECGHNMSGERNDHSQKFETNPLISFDVKDQDNNNNNYNMSSSPHLPTDEDVEDGEVSGEFMGFMLEIDAKSVDETGSEPKDLIGTQTGLENENYQVPLSAKRVACGGKDMVGIANKTNRNLVDYSEIGFDSSPLHFEHVQPAQTNSKINATKKQDLVCTVKDNDAQNNKKRQQSCSKDERANKKSRKSVDLTACPENMTSLGGHHKNPSQELSDASMNEGVANEKKKKRVLTKERKAKKKRKERIKRAETNRKLGVKRLKIQPIIKEKKISYCRHYLKGRCHEGEKCKFSHDTIPLTKSKPCCHFARHACMKGDDCPFDHQLSKYPCNNHQTKGFCSRGSDCMFSHEAQPSESSLTASNGSEPEQQPPSVSGSKMPETKPKSITSSIERNLVETTTPKLSARPPKGMSFLSQEKPPPKGISFLSQEKPPPKGISFLSQEKPPPKGISFLSQEKPPQESNASPKVDSEVKEITKTSPLIQNPKTPQVIQDSKEITETSSIAPRGINFLSFGKKPGLDHSNGGFAFKISSGIEKSRLSNVEGESLKSESTLNMVKGVNVDFPTDRPSSSQKPITMPPFMSNTSQKALQSTLAFASKFESFLKTNRPANSVQKL